MKKRQKMQRLEPPSWTPQTRALHGFIQHEQWPRLWWTSRVQAKILGTLAKMTRGGKCPGQHFGSWAPPCGNDSLCSGNASAGQPPVLCALRPPSHPHIHKQWYPPVLVRACLRVEKALHWIWRLVLSFCLAEGAAPSSDLQTHWGRWSRTGWFRAITLCAGAPFLKVLLLLTGLLLWKKRVNFPELKQTKNCREQARAYCSSAPDPEWMKCSDMLSLQTSTGVIKTLS